MKSIMLCIPLLIACIGCSTQPNIDWDKVLQIETVATQWPKTGMVQVKARFTNKTKRPIALAQVMCILKNRKGEEIGVGNNYVVKPGQPPLVSGHSKEFTYVIYGDYATMSRIEYEVKALKLK